MTVIILLTPNSMIVLYIYLYLHYNFYSHQDLFLILRLCKRLILYKYCKIYKKDKDEFCPICYESFYNMRILTTKCNHIYHFQCLNI